MTNESAREIAPQFLSS